MVKTQILHRGITDPATVNSMSIVPRHLFVPKNLRSYAYDDCPHPIGYKQVISQPYLVGLMTQAAKLDSTSIVLEIGTGSGYAAAVLSMIAKEVYTIERISSFVENANRIYQKQGYTNIHVTLGDGTLGWPEYAPYDAIISTAGAPIVPEALKDQLKPNGRLIIPIGDRESQNLLCYQKTPEGSFMKKVLHQVRFVPLIGEQGWED